MSRNTFVTQTSFRAFAPNLTDIVFAVVFLVALASGSKMLSLDSDLGRHLTIGDYILDHFSIPTYDLFSHTMVNQSRPPYEWLSQVLFAFADRLFGLDGVILLTALIIAITFALVFRCANRRCGSPIIAFLITFLAVGASSIHWLPRPHIITFLLLAIWIENLEQLRRGKPLRVVTFPLIMLFWANLHGGFMFGILAWFAYFAGWLWAKWRKNTDDQTGWKLLIAGLTSLLASVITPDFWRNWEAVLNNRSSFILSRTVETMQPTLISPSFFPFTVFLVLTIILFIVNYRNVPESHYFLVGGLGLIALLMARNIPLFVIVCVPIVADLAKDSLIHWKIWNHIEKRFSGFSQQTPLHIYPLAVSLLAVVLFTNQHINNHQTIFQFSPQVFPVQAMNWLEIHPQRGRMFNEFNWGGYILYRAWPHQRVFLDSQSDFYGEALTREYARVMYLEDRWESVLEKYDVSWVIVPSGRSLVRVLQDEKGWDILYQDSTAAIIRKP